MSDRCQRAIDDCIVEGWDRGGIHCWSSHSMESLGFIEERSEHIALVDRTFSDGSVSTFNFRRYVNKDGERRFVMLCIDDSEVVHDGAPLRIWITKKHSEKDVESIFSSAYESLSLSLGVMREKYTVYSYTVPRNAK